MDQLCKLLQRSWFLETVRLSVRNFFAYNAITNIKEVNSPRNTPFPSSLLLCGSTFNHCFPGSDVKECIFDSRNCLSTATKQSIAIYEKRAEYVRYCLHINAKRMNESNENLLRSNNAGYKGGLYLKIRRGLNTVYSALDHNLKPIENDLNGIIDAGTLTYIAKSIAKSVW